MSGLSVSREELSDGKHASFTFEQPVVIPSYLVAIVIGNLQSKRVGPISQVWSEAEQLDKAAHGNQQNE